MKLIAVLAPCPLAVVAILLPCHAATIRVPGDQPTIQSAIDVATHGDVVLIAPGIYTGPGNKNLSFQGKRILVRGEGGPSATLIDCQGSGRGVSFQNGETQESVVQDLTIRNGNSGTAGAILCQGASPKILNCVISGNNGSEGGAVYCEESSPIFEDCTFSGNTGASGGAMKCQNFSAPILSNCQFLGNSAYDGGGLLLRSESSAVVTNCTFRNNTARQAGGGIRVQESAPRISNCRFFGNFCAMYGGAISILAQSQVLMTNCVLANNNCGIWGGAIYCSNSGPTIRNCTIVSNGAGNGYLPGVIYLQSSPIAMTVQNTIVAHSPTGPAFSCDPESHVVIQCSDVYGNGGNWVGCIASQQNLNGNLSADPRLCNIVQEDFRLEPDSPCAPQNTGTCGLIGGEPATCGLIAVDLATWGRIKNTYAR